MRLLGPGEAVARAPTLAIALERSGAEAAERLAARGIMAGGGDFYAHRPLRALGLDPAQGVLRLSFVHYTSAEEVDAAVAAMDAAL